MTVSMKVWPSLKLIHVGSKARSLGQILEKVLLKIIQGDKHLDEFEIDQSICSVICIRYTSFSYKTQVSD